MDSSIINKNETKTYSNRLRKLFVYNKIHDTNNFKSKECKIYPEIFNLKKRTILFKECKIYPEIYKI